MSKIIGDEKTLKAGGSNSMQNSGESLVYTVEEARMALGGRGRNQMYEAVARGEIPSVKIGGRILIPKAAFEKWLNGELTQTKTGAC
jgi:excisionase family DNA binding protein